MSGGNIVQYTQKNPGANRLMLVHTSPVSTIHKGNPLTISIARRSLPRPLIPSWTRYFTRLYRPGRKINPIDRAHIDARCIKGNILVTGDGRACLGDFGIVGAFGDLSFPRFKLGTARYMALERLDFFNGSPSKKSDVYSLAMTSFTVCVPLSL